MKKWKLYGRQFLSMDVMADVLYELSTNDKDKNLKEDIHNFVNQHVAEYKRLRGGIEFLDAIPKSASGKILRKDLKALFAKMNRK